jgi:hypothetical protein
MTENGIKEVPAQADNGLTGKGPKHRKGAECFHAVQAAEAEEINRRRSKFGICSDDIANPEGDGIGLTLSGGGIRSATFCLGILQQLASRNILKHVDYISTVSGGGYIGSWLCSWIQREQKQTPEDPLGAFNRVSDGLKPNPIKPEPTAITFLRQYSNYLTPRFSVFSADTWVVGAIWLRNSLLNLALLVAFFSTIVLLMRMLSKFAVSLRWPDAYHYALPFSLAFVFFLPGVWFIALYLHRNSKAFLNEKCEEPPDDQLLRNFVLASSLISAVFYSQWLCRNCDFVAGTFWEGIKVNFVALFICSFSIHCASLPYACRQNYKQTYPNELSKVVDRFLTLALYIIAPAAVAFVTASLLRLTALLFDYLLSNATTQQPWFVFVLGPILVMSSFAAGMALHVGLMGRDLPESSREWLSRLGAMLIMVKAIWLAVAGASIYGPWLLLLLAAKSIPALGTLGTGWLTTTIASVFAGKSSKTSGDGENTKQKGSSILEALALVGPYVFMVGFILLISLGTHLILVHGLPDRSLPPTLSSVEHYDAHIKDGVIQLSKEPPKTTLSPVEHSYRGYWLQLEDTVYYVRDPERWFASGLGTLFGIVAIAGLLLGCRVDVNLFSLHNFYQNRLVRCYLGASNRDRKPDPFTAFDPADDLALAQFTSDNKYYGPYPIQNATLNVTSGGMLQYQERQAESFIFTPRYTGFSAEKPANKMRLFDGPMELTKRLVDYQDDHDKHQEHAHAYRPTAETGGGISLGMGMAISGAAVNPNMGYHTSTAVAFLLTVFNVRLGWWLGNCLKKNVFQKSSPPFGVLYILQELVGMANANRAYVNLSDGGHFDNMGIYELVRRRCRYIICCDGEEDSESTFEGIGIAIRKCRTDFGIDIDLPITPLRKVDGVSPAHCTVGRIKYEKDENRWGYLVYMKATLTGDEPTDVLEYHNQKTEFPDQSTADQWFDESQFESYRKLGYHIANKAFSSLTLDSANGDREKFFSDLFQVWYPASPAVVKNTPAHVDMYARIFDEVRRDPTLASIDKDLFKGYSPLVGSWVHNGSHLCNSLVQLMERIFYDLNLEDRDTWEHPYVRGWINIFIDWTDSGSFKQAWAITQFSYPERFCAFYNYLELKRGKRLDD